MLRDYQEEAVRALLRGLREHRSVLAGLPTGSGKSLVLAALAKALRDEGHRVMLAVHTRELVSQDEAACRALGLEPGVWCAGLGRKEWGDFVVGTPRSLLAGRPMRERIEGGAFDILLVDEAHRVNVRERSSDYAVLFRSTKKQAGVTATPFRKDSRCTLVGPYTYNSFEKLVVNFSINDLVARGWLCPLRDELDKGGAVTAVPVGGLKAGADGDFDEAEMERRACALVSQHVSESLPYVEAGKKALCFGVSVKHVGMLEREFMARGVAARGVTGEMRGEERDGHLADFREGRIRVMVNCEILTTGFDCPDVDVLLVMRPTLSRVLYTQILGRGTRKAAGKDFCQVVDFGGNGERFGGVYPERFQKHAAVLVMCLQCGKREVDAGVIRGRAVFREFLDRHGDLELERRMDGEPEGAKVLEGALRTFLAGEAEGGSEEEQAESLEFRKKLVKMLSCPPCQGRTFPVGMMAALCERLEKLQLKAGVDAQEARFLQEAKALEARYGKGLVWDGEEVAVEPYVANSGVRCIRFRFLNKVRSGDFVNRCVHTEFLPLTSVSREVEKDRQVQWNVGRTLRGRWQLASAVGTACTPETVAGWMEDKRKISRGALLFLEEQPGSRWKKIIVLHWRPGGACETGKEASVKGGKTTPAPSHP